MEGYQKFLPEITPLHQPFWDALKHHDAKLQRCDSCGTFRFIPTELCHRCHSAQATWTTISGRGELYAFTVVHRGPTPAYQADTPYLIAHVTMEEGPRMISHLTCEPDVAQIGMTLQLVYDDVTPDLTLYRFTPAVDS